MVFASRADSVTVEINELLVAGLTCGTTREMQRHLGANLPTQQPAVVPTEAHANRLAVAVPGASCLVHASADQLFARAVRTLSGSDRADRQPVGKIREAQAFEIPELDHLSARR